MVVQNPVAEMEGMRTAVEVERVVLEAQLQSYKESLAQPIEVVPEEVEVVIESNPEVVDFKAQILQQRARIRERQRQNSLPDNPALKRLTGTLEDLEKALEELKSELRPRLTAEIKAALHNQRARLIADLEEKVQNKRQLEEVWQKRVSEQRQKSEKAGDQSVELEFGAGRAGAIR